MLYLVTVMLLCGLVGGLANFLRLPDDVPPSKAAFSRSMLLGLIAACVIPLFLTLAKSEIVNGALKPPYGADILAFAGFCLVAALYSGVFLDTVAERVLSKVRAAEKKVEQAKNEVVSAKDEVKTIADIVDAAVTEPTEPKLSALERENSISQPLSDVQIRIMDRLKGGRWLYRSLSGLAKETQMGTGDLLNELQELKSRGLVAPRPSKTEEGVRWYLTDLGRATFAT